MLRRGPECKKTAGPEDQSHVYTQVTTHCLLHTPTSSHLGPIAPGAGGGGLSVPKRQQWVWGAPLPMCRLVSSTAAFRLTLDSRPRQKRSELEGSVKPSTVMDGCEAWNVSPTRWFSS